jgi:hypothetical protein
MAAFNEQRQSPDSMSRLEALTSLCIQNTSPRVQVFDFSLGFYLKSITPCTSITDYYFPPEISQETRSGLEKLRGLRAWPSSPPMAKLYRPQWQNGWSYDTPSFKHEHEGKPTLVFRVVDFWRQDDSEETFKAKASLYKASKGDTPMQFYNLWETFQEELTKAGMFGMREVHIDVKRIEPPPVEYTEEDFLPPEALPTRLH